MASTPTPTWALRYPTGTPGVPPDVKTDLQNLATDTDAALTKATADTGWSTGPLTAATGWTIDTTTPGIRKVGRQVELKVRANSTSISASTGNQGNIAPDLNVFSLGSAYVSIFAPSYLVYGNFNIPGSVKGTARINSAGQVAITDMYPNNSFTNGAVLQFTMTWLIG